MMKPASMKLFATLVLVVTCLMTNEMGGGLMVVDGRKCESESQKFKGTCLSETNCATVCKSEGFTSGDCRGVRRRCFCTKEC